MISQKAKAYINYSLKVDKKFNEIYGKGKWGYLGAGQLGLIPGHFCESGIFTSDVYVVGCEKCIEPRINFFVNHEAIMDYFKILHGRKRNK